MRYKYISIICILSLPICSWATDPPVVTNNNDGKNQLEVNSTESKSESQKPINEVSDERSKITNNAEIKDNGSDNASLSKFNYLFYFIYKYKYQNKEIISDLEEKI